MSLLIFVLICLSCGHVALSLCRAPTWRLSQYPCPARSGPVVVLLAAFQDRWRGKVIGVCALCFEGQEGERASRLAAAATDWKKESRRTRVAMYVGRQKHMTGRSATTLKGWLRSIVEEHLTLFNRTPSPDSASVFSSRPLSQHLSLS